MSAEEGNLPVIEYPCDYPIKVMGVASESFRDTVEASLKKQGVTIVDDGISVRHSRDGNYLAVTVVIRALGPEQIQSIFSALKTIEGIRMVL